MAPLWPCSVSLTEQLVSGDSDCSSINQSIEIFSVPQIETITESGDHESVNGETTLKCEETIYEIKMF